MNHESISLKEKLQSVGANLILVWGALLLYTYNPYYRDFLFQETKGILFWSAVLYSLYLLISLFFKSKRISKGLVILAGIGRYLRAFFHYTINLGSVEGVPFPSFSKDERNALLFLLVKLFFLPIMVNFVVGNFAGFSRSFASLSLAEFFTAPHFIGVTYPLLLSLIFLIDTFFFTFGYLVESEKLDNQVRSVEPTVLGWVVALVCYPPFNEAIGNRYFNWYASDYAQFSSTTATLILYIFILFSFFIYLWATVALGTKSSNLTNRGIIGHGPYAYVRHPHYASKNLAWWISLLPILSIGAVLSMIAWSAIYYLRAITEERHLITDPEYQAYCKKVPYRFIPGIW